VSFSNTVARVSGKQRISVPYESPKQPGTGAIHSDGAIRAPAFPSHRHLSMRWWASAARIRGGDGGVHLLPAVIFAIFVCNGLSLDTGEFLNAFRGLKPPLFRRGGQRHLSCRGILAGQAPRIGAGDLSV
jgi:hypothetical protein